MLTPNWDISNLSAPATQKEWAMEILYPIPAAIITAIIVGLFGWMLQRQLLRHQDRSQKRETIVGFISKYRSYELFVRPSDGMHFVDPQQFGTDFTNAVLWSIGLDDQAYLEYLRSQSEDSFREVLGKIAEAGQVPLGNLRSFYPWSCRLQDDPKPGMIVPYIHSPGQFPGSSFHVEDCPDSPYHEFRRRNNME